ncbi:hypothetical protein FSP39_000623 [Pinctada imbricata]|uniref:Uncharacterized protein n=1 Tax=Pinctada imbricata TaxID=66713 RepID=A0AA89BS73_PINIB|nr:hypothetical protein FSP39_000623 [Pinctada imbricata]
MADIQGLPPLPRCFSGVFNPQSPDDDSEQNLSITSANSLSEVTLTNGHLESNCDNGLKDEHKAEETHHAPQLSPFVRLNFALSKLREEMIGLRKLDLSLLTQLWSLNDAIQEYKNAMQDRYSECNSEYSYGMNSRTSSMCSINDYDWNEDIHLKPDNLIASSLHSSTSSLLQQINELKERAESEF